MSAVDRTGVGRPGSVHHVIDGIESERDVSWYPEDAVAAANNHLWRQPVCEAQARGEIVFLQRQIAARPGRHQENIAHHGWKSGRQELIDVTAGFGIEIGEAVVALGPWTLQLVTQPQIHREAFRNMPGVIYIECVISALSRSKGGHYRLRKEVVFEVAVVVGIA